MTTQYKIGMHMYLLGIAELAIYSFVKGDFCYDPPASATGGLAWNQSISPV